MSNEKEVKEIPVKKTEKENKRKEQTGRGGMIETEPIAGTRDFIPKDMRLRNWLFGQWKEVARVFGFEEYDAPILEPEELYKRKAGEEITEQMYNFKEKSGLAVALRPEMTPTLARLILKQGKALIMPIKYFSIPQCWRYENTAKGRKREHFQWNMDIWGVKSVTAEAELLAAIVTFFERVSVTSKDVVIKISSRKILQSIVESLGISPDKFASCCVIVDKLDKLEKAKVVEELAKLEISEDVAISMIDVLATKNINDLKSKLKEEQQSCLGEIELLFSLAKSYGIDDWLQFDASIVRGLSYYTGVVFEAFCRDPKSDLKRAIVGGGRYDKILATYGAKTNIEACGFGFGDCVIIDLLEWLKKVPTFDTRVDDLIVMFDEDLRGDAITVATKLRKIGRSVDMILPMKEGNNRRIKLDSAYSYADRLGVTRVILIAPEEWKNKQVRVKYLKESKGKNEKSENEVTIDLEKLFQ
jgi:histidyl-tRNA synthetase